MGLAFSLALIDLIDYYKKNKQNERKNVEKNLNKELTTDYYEKDKQNQRENVDKKLNKESTTTNTFSKPQK